MVAWQDGRYVDGNKSKIMELTLYVRRAVTFTA